MKNYLEERCRFVEGRKYKATSLEYGYKVVDENKQEYYVPNEYVTFIEEINMDKMDIVIRLIKELNILSDSLSDKVVDLQENRLKESIEEFYYLESDSKLNEISLLFSELESLLERGD